MSRKAYPSDVSDDEWAFIAPYLTLMSEAAPQREYDLREIFNGLRWIVRAGAAWRMMPNDLPPWHVVYDQAQRWLKAGVFAAIGHDLREVLRVAAAANRSRRRLSWTAGRCNPAQKAARGRAVTLPNAGAAVKSIRRWIPWASCWHCGSGGGLRHSTGVIKLPQAKKGFVLLPRRWVVERSFAWTARLRRLARDYERLPETLAGLHCLAFAILMLGRFVSAMAHLLQVHNTL